MKNILSVLTQSLNLLSLWIIFSPILKLFNIFLGKILDIMAKNLESWSGCIRSWSRLPRSWPRSIRFFRWVFTHLKSGRPSIVPIKLSQYTFAEVQARGLIEINLLLLTKDSSGSSPDQADGEDSESDGEDITGTNEESPTHYITVVDFQRACYLRRKAGGEKDMLSLCRYCMAGFRDMAGLEN